MKYVLVIPDGAADFPLAELGGKTPLEAAAKPNMDRIAREGVLGTVDTIPEGFPPGSDVAIMSVLGYDPREFYSGRAPLEAASMGIALGENDWALRCNLVTIAEGRMIDYSAGHISPSEAAEIVKTLNGQLGGPGVEFYAGKGYRNLLVLRGLKRLRVETTPPHDIKGEETAKHLPRGKDAGVLKRLMDASGVVLLDHRTNRRRAAAGQVAATHIWLWGEGRSRRLPSYGERYGVAAAVITAVDLVAGISALAGWQRIVVPGATGYYDTDYRGKGRAAAKALDKYDLVFVHVEAPDEASHNRDAREKVRAIEEIDKHVAGPLLEALSRRKGWRILVLPDHYTPVQSAAHSGEPVPFAICGRGIEASGSAAFSERAAVNGPHISKGYTLMGEFLGKAEQWAL